MSGERIFVCALGPASCSNSSASESHPSSQRPRPRSSSSVGLSQSGWIGTGGVRSVAEAGEPNLFHHRPSSPMVESARTVALRPGSPPASYRKVDGMRSSSACDFNFGAILRLGEGRRLGQTAGILPGPCDRAVTSKIDGSSCDALQNTGPQSTSGAHYQY